MIKKIIISNKFKRHMEVHEGDFKMPYMELIKEFESSTEFQNSSEDFIVTTKDFGQIVGLEKVVKILSGETILYAKRKGRDIYSKFVQRDEKGIETNKVVFILNRSRNNLSEYYMVTMYPGNGSEKEPEDKSIKDIQELEKCLDFWEDRAFILEEDLIQSDTITRQMPYRNLYDKLKPIVIMGRDGGFPIYEPYSDDTIVIGFYNDEETGKIFLDLHLRGYDFGLEFNQIGQEELIKVKVFLYWGDCKKIQLDTFYFKTYCGVYFEKDFYRIYCIIANYIYKAIKEGCYDEKILTNL